MMLLRNLILLRVVFGFYHFTLYMKKVQGTKGKYNPNWQEKGKKKFLFRNQILDNIFFTCISGAPVWFIARFLIIPFWRETHFYFIHRLLHWKPLLRAVHSLHHRNRNISEEHSGTIRAAEALADFPALNGNETELLIDGEQTFDSILQGIDSAEKYILFQFYIIRDDELGTTIKDHLLASAARGVKVYFLYDEIGSIDLSKSYLNDLRNGGIEVRSFNTRKGRGNRFQLNFRNHRKIVVTDGRSAWVGGHNVGDEYLGKDPKFGNWRDTHLRITGPAALSLQLSFAVDWYWAADAEIPELSWSPVPSPTDTGEVLIISSGPADKYDTASLMFLHAINSAQGRIWISSPYFVPDDAIIYALQLAGLRGVDVRIIIPDEPDHMLVYLAAFTYFDDASLTGARIYRYTNGFTHGKTMLIDDKIAAIGTANFDNRSFRLNFEITALSSDSGLIGKMEDMFNNDFSNSRLMTRADVDERSFWFRLAIRFARLTSPIL